MLLFRAQLRHHRRHPLQFLLSVLGVALGVAVVVAIDLANASAERAFALSSAALTGPATHEVVGGPQGVPEAEYARLRLMRRVRRSAPVVEAPVSRGDAGKGAPLTLLGVDPIAEAGLRTRFALGGDEAAFARLIAEPRTTLLPAATARRLGARAGDTIALHYGRRSFSLRVIGLLPPRGPLDGRALRAVLLTDIATAQEVLGFEGRLTRIDLVLPDAAAVQALRAGLPPGLRLVGAQARSTSLEQMTRAFHLNLTAMSLLALLVGAFLIYNTMTFAVIRRFTEFGTLRALGVGGGQLVLQVELEAALIGLLGTGAGLLLGVSLADVLLGLVTRTINDLYYASSVSSVFLTPASFAKGAVLGVGATLAAALLPALEAGRIRPRAVMTRSAFEARVRRALPLVAGAGLVSMGAAGALLLWPTRSLVIAFAALFGLMVGFALLVPLLAVLLLRPLRRFAAASAGQLGNLAVRAIRASLSRTGVALAALTVAVSATAGVGMMIDSFRGTVQEWLADYLRADVFISPLEAAGREQVLSMADARAVRALPRVAYVSVGRRIDLQTEQGRIQLFALDIPRASFSGFRFKHGDPAAARRAFFEGGAVIVSEPYAYRHDVGVGDRIVLPTPAGPRRFAVAGVYYDYGSDQGYVTMARATYVRVWHDPAITSLGVYLAAGASADGMAARLRRLLPQAARLDIVSNRGLREASLAIFDRTFTITSVLRVLAIVVAVVGVLSALLAIQLERARELALMRAMGLTPGQLWALVMGESGILGLLAGVLALPLGALLSLVLVAVINRRSFGWTMQLHVDPGLLGQTVALAVGAALLAGVWPAARMARMSPAAGLREE